MRATGERQRRRRMLNVVRPDRMAVSAVIAAGSGRSLPVNCRHCVTGFHLEPNKPPHKKQAGDRSPARSRFLPAYRLTSRRL